MYQHSIARAGVSSRSSSGRAKNGRCRTAPGPPPPPPAGLGAEASLLLPPTVLLSSPLLCRRSYFATSRMCDLEPSKVYRQSPQARGRCRSTPGAAKNLHPFHVMIITAAFLDVLAGRYDPENIASFLYEDSTRTAFPYYLQVSRPQSLRSYIQALTDPSLLLVAEDMNESV